ncbi:MAG: hypothetical protein AAF845_16365 [Bacteroidota bacterium]
MTDPLLALQTVARGLGPLLQEVTFVGGAVTPLLVTDIGSEGIRPTDDVDLIVDAPTRSGYDRLGAVLRARSFRHDTSDGAPICRHVYEGVAVDVMPVDPDILGFSNRWYRYALESAEWADLGDGIAIRVIPFRLYDVRIEPVAAVHHP